MPGTAPSSPSRVVIYGGGAAALETALALRERVGEGCEITLVSPVRDFAVRGIGSSLASGADSGRFDLAVLAGELGLRFVGGIVVAVDVDSRRVRTLAGASIRFDALVLSSGARLQPAVPGATTYWGRDEDLFDELVADLSSGACRRPVFAIPSSIGWTLPVYEVALAIRRRIAEPAAGGPVLSIATYEGRPAEILGAQASEVLERRLSGAGIELFTGHDPTGFDGRRLASTAAAAVLADRVLAPAARGAPRISGLPIDERGFVPVDGCAGVVGASNIWAVGDVTGLPVHEPGIVAQQATLAAHGIAAALGAGTAPTPVPPVVRGVLRGASGNGNGQSAAIWWPPGELAGRHLWAHLAPRLDVRRPGETDGVEVEVELSPDGVPQNVG